jgi:hypothetical protein
MTSMPSAGRGDRTPRNQQMLGACRTTTERDRLRGDAGAGLPEYALGLSLIVVVSVGGVQRLNESSKAEAGNQADCISERPPPPSCVRRPVPAAQPPADDPGEPPTTDATVAPSTDPPITPTTVPAPTSAVVGGSVSTDLDGDGTWRFTYDLAVSGPDGEPVDAVVQGRVLVEFPGGVPQGFVVACSPSGEGRYACEFDGIPIAIDAVRFDIFRVTATPPASPPYPSELVLRPDPAAATTTA